MILIALFINFESCANGPEITSYIVDAPNKGFQCIPFNKPGYFVPAQAGIGLNCISPTDMDLEIEACKKHEILPVTVCKLENSLDQFNCLHPDGTRSILPFVAADKYWCISDKDKERIEKRCKR